MKKRIAVLDGNGALCAHVRNLLGEADVEFLPLQASSPETAALALAALRPLDALLFDCMGQNGLGLATAAQIRRDPDFTQLPLLASTALPLTPALSARFLANNLIYLRRPFTRSDLETLLFGAVHIEESIENFN
ncbi:MAG: hypothetical protein V1913_11210 [Fibrobacterota bacterium]